MIYDDYGTIRLRQELTSRGIAHGDIYNNIIALRRRLRSVDEHEIHHEPVVDLTMDSDTFMEIDDGEIDLTMDSDSDAFIEPGVREILAHDCSNPEGKHSSQPDASQHAITPGVPANLASQPDATPGVPANLASQPGAFDPTDNSDNSGIVVQLEDADMPDTNGIEDTTPEISAAFTPANLDMDMPMQFSDDDFYLRSDPVDRALERDADGYFDSLKSLLILPQDVRVQIFDLVVAATLAEGWTTLRSVCKQLADDVRTMEYHPLRAKEPPLFYEPVPANSKVVIYEWYPMAATPYPWERLFPDVKTVREYEYVTITPEVPVNAIAPEVPVNAIAPEVPVNAIAPEVSANAIAPEVSANASHGSVDNVITSPSNCLPMKRVTRSQTTKIAPEVSANASHGSLDNVITSPSNCLPMKRVTRSQTTKIAPEVSASLSGLATAASTGNTGPPLKKRCTVKTSSVVTGRSVNPSELLPGLPAVFDLSSLSETQRQINQHVGDPILRQMLLVLASGDTPSSPALQECTLELFERLPVQKFVALVHHMWNNNPPLRRVVEQDLWQDVKALKAIGGELCGYRFRIYLDLVSDLSNDEFLRIYTGRAKKIKDRMASHSSYLSIARNAGSFHYWTATHTPHRRSHFVVFGMDDEQYLTIEKDLPLQLLDHFEEILEMHTMLMFQTLPPLIMRKWLPDGVPIRPPIGLNVRSIGYDYGLTTGSPTSTLEFLDGTNHVPLGFLDWRRIRDKAATHFGVVPQDILKLRVSVPLSLMSENATPEISAIATATTPEISALLDRSTIRTHAVLHVFRDPHPLSTNLSIRQADFDSAYLARRTFKEPEIVVDRSAKTYSNRDRPVVFHTLRAARDRKPEDRTVQEELMARLYEIHKAQSVKSDKVQNDKISRIMKAKPEDLSPEEQEKRLKVRRWRKASSKKQKERYREYTRIRDQIPEEDRTHKEQEIVTHFKAMAAKSAMKKAEKKKSAKK